MVINFYLHYFYGMILQLDDSTTRQFRQVVNHTLMRFLVLHSWFDYKRRNLKTNYNQINVKY